MADFEGQTLASISSRDIDDWLRALPVSGVTRNTFRRRLSTLFGYGDAVKSLPFTAQGEESAGKDAPAAGEKTENPPG